MVVTVQTFTQQVSILKPLYTQNKQVNFNLYKLKLKRLVWKVEINIFI